MNFRVGIGYDVHKLVYNRKLIIGGVLIPFDKGLLGHSDADVLIHSIIDSLLGATKLGDIGSIFPDSDPSFKNISSLTLLKNVSNLLKKNEFYISNIDCTIVAQMPKMRPYINSMEKNIADCLNLDFNQISVKATTEEGLGFTGSLEGISASSVCLVYKN